MRIVAGKLKSRTIIAPKSNAKDTTVRPTSDKVRQAIFNVLEHAAWCPSLVDTTVLDLFCGTGALGIEALSRGAAHVTFVDRDVTPVKANVRYFSLDTKCRVLPANALALPPTDRPCDFIFIDPPYNQGLIDPVLQNLQDKNWLHSDSVIVAESEKEWSSALFQPISEKIHGISKISFFCNVVHS